MNKTVQSLKIDPNTVSAYGSIDADGDDTTVYDHVIMSADLGAVQRIVNNTYDIYKSNANVKSVLDDVINKSLGKMKVAPDYKVIFFLIIKLLKMFILINFSKGSTCFFR